MKMITKGLLAATALVTLPSLAHASVIVSNVNISVPGTTAGVYINLVTGLNSATVASVPGWDINPWGSGSLFLYNPTGGGFVVPTSGGTSAASLATGAVIGASSFFGSNVTGTAFLTGGDQVFGFKFLNESTGAVNYGYGRITTTAGGNGRPATITQLVYENSGASLTVGAAATGGVPEPTTWAMMVMGFGAIGFAVRRRTNVKTAVRFA